MPGTVLFGIAVESACEDTVGFVEFAEPLFTDLQCHVTWFLTGQTLEKYPDLFRRVEKNPYIDLQSHTYAHILLKTVIWKLPKGVPFGSFRDWVYKRGASVDEMDADLERCQGVFQDVLGRKAVALTSPWGYYRGLMDRPDMLELCDKHGFKVIRTFSRNEQDGEPIPFEWQPFFYEPQGFGHILETMIHGFQDDYAWRYVTRPAEGASYGEYLKTCVDRVAGEDLVWGVCSHDHGCADPARAQEKGAWYRGLVEYAMDKGCRFFTSRQFYEEMLARKAEA